jgi:hypothetical protein
MRGKHSSAHLSPSTSLRGRRDDRSSRIAQAGASVGRCLQARAESAGQLALRSLPPGLSGPTSASPRTDWYGSDRPSGESSDR